MRRRDINKLRGTSPAIGCPRPMAGSQHPLPAVQPVYSSTTCYSSHLQQQRDVYCFAKPDQRDTHCAYSSLEAG
jgi:hypothetical protein